MKTMLENLHRINLMAFFRISPVSIPLTIYEA